MHQANRKHLPSTEGSAPLEAGIPVPFREGAHEHTDRGVEALRALRAPSRERSEPLQHGPVDEPPKNPHPTRSWGYRWLGVGVAAGSAAAIGAAIGTGGAAATWLIGNGWDTALVCTAILAAARIAKPFVFTRIAESVYNDDSGPTDIAARIEEASKEMSRRAGIPAPIVCSSKRVKNFGMIDGIGDKNILLYNPDFARELSPKETTAIVAHEIAHADRVSGKLRLMISGASGVTSLSTFIGSIAYCSGSGLGLLSSGAIVIGASILSGTMMRTLSSVFSRAAELRTDIRAVELTGDLGGYLGGLKTASEITNRGVPKWIQVMQPFSTHPSFETREWWIRRACGNPRHEAE
ncbi:MAG: hypothetical protein RL417_2059 [Pseudomonadota bacterium]